MHKLIVKVDGKVIGSRKTDRIYSHAVVGLQVAVSRSGDAENYVVPVEPRWVVCSFHASEALAQKASQADYLTGDKSIRSFLRERHSSFERIHVVPVEQETK